MYCSGLLQHGVLHGYSDRSLVYVTDTNELLRAPKQSDRETGTGSRPPATGRRIVERSDVYDDLFSLCGDGLKWKMTAYVASVLMST